MLYDCMWCSRRVEIIETESRIAITWGWGRGDEQLSNGDRASVREDETVLELESD